jgi:hypothetical protein
MEYPKEEIEELERYCSKISALTESSVSFLYLAELRLPAGCQPQVCDALLCPVERDGYPSRLYLAVQVTCLYARNWNVTNARIGEKNWFAFSWRVAPTARTLPQMLVAHLEGFARDK